MKANVPNQSKKVLDQDRYVENNSHSNGVTLKSSDSQVLLESKTCTINDVFPGTFIFLTIISIIIIYNFYFLTNKSYKETK